MNSLQSRRRTQNHSVVGIQGDPGVGKSTVALLLALNLDPAFTVERVHYNRKAWRTIASAEKGQVFILDEGANVAMSRTWMEKGQVQLMQLLNMIRQRHHTLIWCTPNLQRLDVVIREDLLTHKVNCTDRGKARVLTRYRNREGEPAGWKLWPGIMGWSSLDDHPIWPSYYAAKEANYAAKSVEMTIEEPVDRRGKSGEELAKIRPTARDPTTGHFLKKERLLTTATES